jgi:hypothetical protein
MIFKQRVCNDLKQCAAVYKSVFLEYDYLIYSEGFTKKPYYIITANRDNFAHLTGVKALIPKIDFYEACLNATLLESHFSLSDSHKDENAVKGTVRRKLLAFQCVSDLFTQELQAEEDFSKGSINCSIGAADGRITIGFLEKNVARPMTLLRGNCLDQSKVVNIALVLRRTRNSKKFNTVVQGDLVKFLIANSDIIDMEHLKIIT